MACGGKLRHSPTYSGQKLLSFSLSLSHTHTLFHVVCPRRPLESNEQVPSASPCRYSNPGQSSPQYRHYTEYAIPGEGGVIIIKAGIVRFRPLDIQLQFDSSEQPIGRTTGTKYKIRWTRSRSTATVAATTASRPPHALNIRTWHTDPPGFTLTQNKGHLMSVLSHFYANLKCCVSEMALHKNSNTVLLYAQKIWKNANR